MGGGKVEQKTGKMAGRSEGGGAASVAAEAAKFDALGGEWRSPDGAFAPLHAMQPVRLSFARDHLTAAFGRDPTAPKPLAGLDLVDLGAGGGLASEPMARLGARVVGVDPSEAAITLCRERAAGFGLDIEYRLADAESAAKAAAAADERFDAVLALEVVEHAPDLPAFAEAVAALLKPGGMAVLSTLNRTAASYLGAIVAAERLLGWLARGTHDWRRFPTPDELCGALEASGLRIVDRTGFVYEPLARRWRPDPARLEINYAVVAVKPEG